MNQNSLSEKKEIVSYIKAIIIAILVYILYQSMLLINYIDKSKPHIYTTLSVSLILVLFFIVYTWFNKKERAIEEFEPLKIGRGISIAVFCAVLIFLGQIGLNFFKLMLTGNTDSKNTNQDTIEAMMNNPALFVFTLISLVILAPLLEELVFRRILIGRIPSKKNNLFYVRVFVSIIIFAGIHMTTDIVDGISVAELFPLLTYLMISGIFALVYVTTGSMWYSFTAHVVNNGIAALMLIASM